MKCQYQNKGGQGPEQTEEARERNFPPRDFKNVPNVQLQYFHTEPAQNADITKAEKLLTQ